MNIPQNPRTDTTLQLSTTINLEIPTTCRPSSPGTAKTGDAQSVKVRDWRHKLQKTFLSNKGVPKSEVRRLFPLFLSNSLSLRHIMFLNLITTSPDSYFAVCRFHSFVSLFEGTERNICFDSFPFFLIRNIHHNALVRLPICSVVSGLASRYATYSSKWIFFRRICFSYLLLHFLPI